MSFVSNIIITRFLGPVGFGDFKFLLYVINYSIILFNFGFFQAGNRAIVLSNDEKKTREYYGSMVVMLSAMFAVITIMLIAYAFLDENVNTKGLRSMLIFIIPFTWIFLFVNFFEVLFQADNKIGLLAKSRLYPKIAFFATVLLLYFLLFEFDGNKLKLIWVLFLGSHFVSFIPVMYKVNPSFKNIGTRLKEIWFYNKAYGFNVYFGALFSLGFTALSGLLISYFGIDNSGVGYYSLALTIAEPLGFIPNVIATTHYKDFSTNKSIPRRLILITAAVVCVALLMTWLLVGPFIRFFYGMEFNPVITLTYIVSIGVILNGFADFFNRFLGSHGQGKALRNSAIIVGFCILVFNLTLIPELGEKGAALTLILSSLIYVLNMLWFYRKLILKLAKNPV